MKERPARRRSSAPDDSLLERLRERITSTRQALQSRDLKSRPRARVSPPKRGTAGTPDGSDHSLDFRALHSTYRRLARDHRLYRERSGEPLPPELKAAAQAFKREPSVFSLVPVAGFLDDLGLLKW